MKTILIIALAALSAVPSLAQQNPPADADHAVAPVLQAAERLFRLGQYSAAEASLQAAIPRFQSEPLAHASVLNRLASMYDRAGNYDQAEHYYRASLAAVEPRLASDPELLTPAVNLLGLYIQYSQYGKAERFTRQLDALAPGWRGARHLNAARLLDLSGGMKIQQREFREAEPLLTAAQELLPVCAGAADADWASVLNNLAVVYRSTGRIENALEAARRANDLATSDPSLDSAHRSLSLMNLALIEGEAGHAADAQGHFELGTQLAEGVTTANDPTLADAFAVAAVYLRESGRKRESKHLNKRADAIRAAIGRSTSVGQTVDYQSFQAKTR